MGSDVAAVTLDAAIARACDRIPGHVRSALMLIPDGFLLAAVGASSVLDLEPLVRAATRCAVPTAFVEVVFANTDQLVVIQAGRREPRIALGVIATRDHNLGFVLGATRIALRELEQDVDLARWL